MKTLFTLTLLLVAVLQVTAQTPETTSTLKPAVIFYNAQAKVSKKEQAAFYRVAYLPERLKDIKGIRTPKFDGPVRDFYANGNALALGAYNDGKKWGAWTFYYPNGQLDCKGEFDDRWAKGEWQFWYPNGKPMMVAVFDRSNVNVVSYWNAASEQTITRSTGTYTAISHDENGREVKIEGRYAAGKQVGNWTYGPVNGPVEIQLNFDETPQPFSEKVLLETKNIFEISPEPDYLAGVEAWESDYAQYAPDYPVVADVLKAEVQKIALSKSKKIDKNYYYRIVQQHSAGTDTLKHGMPVTEPEFGKNLNTYINNSFRFPPQLKGRVEGLLIIGFTIKADGTVADVKVMSGLSPLLDKEGIRMVEAMPKWKPATIDGKAIEFHGMLPIRISDRNIGMDEMRSADNWPY